MFTALTLLLASCGQSAVRPSLFISTEKLPSPPRILVADVVAEQAQVKEYGGILGQSSEIAKAMERRQLRASSAISFQRALIDGLRRLGFRVAGVRRGTPVEESEILIDARCRTIDQGDPVQRLVLGFGAGAAKFETIVSLHHGPAQRKLLEFAALADSGKLPGALITLPAGAVVQGGLTTGLLASSAATSGVSAYLDDMSQMASSSADEAVRYLSEFFARQGWVASHHVRKARIAYDGQTSSGSGAYTTTSEKHEGGGQ